jgi:prephenate dehydrogenase
MDSNPFSEQRIAIVGLGLMGGSLAMALHGKCKALFGVDSDPNAVKFAQKSKLFSKATPDIKEALADAAVIILAAPVCTILKLIQQLPAHFPGNAIVMDIGSTKREIMAAYEQLPARFIPIGGHPMCGKETSSFVHADPSIFIDAPFVFTPLERTTPEAREIANQMAQAIGASPIWMDADTHDNWTAAISHLPYLLSLSLALASPPEAGTLVGPGFKSVVRLAGKPGSMMVDILKTNRDQILQACTHFSNQFNEIYRLIDEADYETIARLIEIGSMKRDALVEEKPN